MNTEDLARRLGHWAGSPHLPPPDTIGPFWFGRLRGDGPAICSRILDHYCRVVRERPECSGSSWPAKALGRGLWGREARRHLAQYGDAASRQYGRSLLQQALDLWSVWRSGAVSPWEYYDGQLARHAGGKALANYMNFRVLTTLLIDIQMRVFGPLELRMYDKLQFHDWCRAHGIPCAPQISLPSGEALDFKALQSLGPQLIVKPRISYGGKDIEAVTAGADGRWRAGGRQLSPPELAAYLAGLAARHAPGILIQQRLLNEPGLGLDGLALSTCRVVTMLNEDGNPEVVEGFRRVPKKPGAVVDNYSSGGDCWMAGEFQNGRIKFGVGLRSTTDQTMLSPDPRHPEFAVGKLIPGWQRVAPFALAAHRHALRTLVVSWDVAATTEGVVMIEANFPPGLVTQWQLVADGFADTRIAQLYDHWLGRVGAVSDAA